MEPTETLTFLGTIAELKAVLKASEIKHSIKDEDDAYLVVDLKGPIMTSATIDFRGSRDKANARYTRGIRDNRYTYAVRQAPNPLAKGVIKGTGNGSTVDLEVDLETDETMPMHKEVHERWQQFYAYLVSRGRLAQEPEAAAAPTEIDRRPEPEAPKEAIRSLPGERGSSEWFDALWDWYYKYTKFHRYTVREVAELAAYSLSHTKRSKSLYDTEHETK